MPTQSITGLKYIYENGEDNIGRDFIRPCLMECSLYRRGAAFFGSSALVTYADALLHVIKDNVKIEILCSPVINDRSLLDTLSENISEDEKVSTILKFQENIIYKAIKFKEDPNHKRRFGSEILAYLIANEQLEIKTAIRKSDEWPEPWPTDDEVDEKSHLYHVKRGYFRFENDEKIVAFDGSFNETLGSQQFHTETAQIFKMWDKDDRKRGNAIISRVDRDWNNQNDDIFVRPLSKELIDKIKQSASKHRPKKTSSHSDPVPPSHPDPIPNPEPEVVDDDFKWRHKNEALKIFVEKKQGILAMATGTGKTTTAIKIANYLFEHNEIDSVIITMFGNSLLTQWYGELMSDDQLKKRLIFKHFSKEKRMGGYLNNSIGKILLITSDKLGELMDHISNEDAQRTLIIYDEVHDMAAPIRKTKTIGRHSKFNYRLGLSATPDRGSFDEEGTDFLFKEIGPIIFPFSIEDAIKRGILVEFDYEALSYQLTDEEKMKIRGIMGSRNYPDKDGKKRTDAEIFIAISDVKKQAENKLLAFNDFLKNKGLDCLKRSIIFVHSKKYGEEVSKIINEFGFTSFNTFYDHDNEENLVKLADNKIDCLITCHKVSQGIDIKSLRNVIIFASSVNKRETIQRLGRVLRSEKNNPNKKAFMLDFCEYEEVDSKVINSDTLRKKWLTELSQTAKEE